MNTKSVALPAINVSEEVFSFMERTVLNFVDYIIVHHIVAVGQTPEEKEILYRRFIVQTFIQHATQDYGEYEDLDF